ncbi:MAG: hypothetical protein J7L15_07895 [Clostridiales bacterium]|nr:hypothetical protein [Clostridiales bacterium]
MRHIGIVEITKFDFSTNVKTTSEHFAIQCIDRNYWELLDVPRHTQRYYHINKKHIIKIITLYSPDEYPEYFL